MLALPVYCIAPASPDKAPAIIIEITIFLLTGIPAYSAPNLLNPPAFNSYPKTVLFKINHIIKTVIIAKKIPKFIYEPLNMSESHCTFKVAASGSILDSVSKNSPLKYCGTI